ncbi:MAG: tyrosine--tRNA ligase [Bacilli bacterium]
MKLSEELQWRGMIHSVTDENVYNLLNAGKISFYIGADATGSSFHIGNLASIIVAKLLQKHGNTPYLLLGGATTRIGDPKATGERNMMSEEKIENNRSMLKKEAGRLIDCEIVNNYDWFKDIGYIDFLREVGKYFNIAYMINKDTVKSRLESGISYTEFSYQLIQAYDFAMLNKLHGITLQIGGQDQWGNITSGIEYVRKNDDYDCTLYGLTAPLILKSDGSKYGKSESGAIWLNKDQTSVYDFYQYFINISDDDALMFLKRFTLLTPVEIENIYEEFLKEPHKRLAQKTVAYEITKLVHGEEGVNSAIRISDALFSSDLSNLSNEEIAMGFSDVYVGNVKSGEKVLDILVDNGLVKSKREGREFIGNGAIAINGEKNTDLEQELDINSAINGKYVLIKKGKKKYYLFEVR